MVALSPRPAFLRDVTQRIEWLGENRSEDQLDNFLAALARVREAIAQNPQAGPIVKQDPRYVLRMRLFPRPLPYLVYFAHYRGDRVAAVFLVRLFGSGQDRPDFDMSEWPW